MLETNAEVLRPEALGIDQPVGILDSPDSLGNAGVVESPETINSAEEGNAQTDDTEGQERAVRPKLMWADPRELRIPPHQIRKDLGDLTELRDGIAEAGVLQALLGVPGEGGIIYITQGQRRRAAAIEAIELGSPMALEVPVLVHDNMSGLTAKQIASMLQENLHRKALTASEEAGGYRQLTLEGWTAEQIAKRTGRKKANVERSLTLAKQGTQIQNAVDKGDLTLEDAAEVAAFDGDKAALDRILKKSGSTWGLRHQVASEKRKRRVADTAKKLRAELDKAGVVVVGKPKGFPHSSREVAVNGLRGPEGESLKDADVRNKPGFAAFIDTSGHDAAVVVICLNPEAHGFTRHGVYSTYVSPTEVARKESEAAKVAAFRTALQTAGELRRTFVVQTFGNAKAAKALYVHALRATLADPALPDSGRDEHELLTGLVGIAPEKVDINDAGEARLVRLLVGRWVAGNERNLNSFLAAPSRFRSEPALSWLDRLSGAGYGLSDAESELRESLTSKPTDQSDSDPDGYEYEDDYEGEAEDDDCEDGDSGDATPLLHAVPNGLLTDDGATSPSIDAHLLQPAMQERTAA
ncbi:ParB N-terminal domain-containing protein [Micromonospora sp. NPDC051141]|uniref:ParB/RepB/Spo0J family partition protein n=1 Tax=Micromonospora sp. NPDC051141 TaxID=3364284 RepID=UPI0037A3B580